ncbi:hypothetical protein GWK36_09530 [Caldichromatium japonicum]|uniref:Tetratricopeptide repeat protein n=1 Tax=Caldichromatium japonicum TaxID=2699430 RepID=A0A6G7VEA0_9GAMM|nr:hypothetical protein [Caldichromatium japonicum]QIK38178.1 hypothetical protein GWK36_09530 [Caldichromatium japonicum]
MTQAHWPTHLAAYPYAQSSLIGWQIADREGDPYWNDYEQALDAYLASQDASLSNEERQAWFLKGRDLFQALSDRGDRHIGTSLALIRIYSELGEPQRVLAAIEQMLELMPWLAEPLPLGLELQINRPFIAPLSDLEQSEILENELGQWLQSGIMAALEAADRALAEAQDTSSTG